MRYALGGQGELAAFVLDRKQSSSVAGSDLPTLDELTDRSGQTEHAEQVRNTRAILPHCVRDLKLSQAELVDEALVALRLFEWVQVGPLKILDERQRQHCPIVEVPHHGRNFGPTQPGHCPESSLACHELPLPASDLPHDDRLQEAARAYRGFQLRELGLGKRPAGLKAVWADIRQA